MWRRALAEGRKGRRGERVVTNKILRAKNRNIDFQLCLDGSSIMLRSFVVHCFLYLCSFHKEDQKNFKKQRKIKKREKTHIISLKTEVVGRPNCAANKTIFVCFYTFCWRLFFGAILSLSPLFHCTFSLNRHPNTIPHSVALSPLFFCAKANLNQKKKIKTKKKNNQKK